MLSIGGQCARINRVINHLGGVEVKDVWQTRTTIKIRHQSH